MKILVRPKYIKSYNNWSLPEPYFSMYSFYVCTLKQDYFARRVVTGILNTRRVITQVTNAVRVKYESIQQPSQQIGSP